MRLAEFGGWLVVEGLQTDSDHPTHSRFHDGWCVCRCCEDVSRMSSSCVVRPVLMGLPDYSAAAPIERIKLLVQNQGEMIKSG